MKGCWDPEFEPSVEEIMEYRWDMAILSVRTWEIFLFSLVHGPSMNKVSVTPLGPLAVLEMGPRTPLDHSLVPRPSPSF
jgi:hypothetical protein